MRPEAKDFDLSQKDGHFNNYADYSRILRAWLVAYGIGGPVLFFSNDQLAKRIASSDSESPIVQFFMLGVGLQVLLAFINKWGAWYMYRGAGDRKFQRSRSYRLWACINAQSWLDLLLDMVSLCAFGIASWWLLSVLLVAAPAS